MTVAFHVASRRVVDATYLGMVFMRSMNSVNIAESPLEDAGRIHELLSQAAAEPWPGGAGLTAQRAEELIAAIRAGRDTR